MVGAEVEFDQALEVGVFEQRGERVIREVEAIEAQRGDVPKARVAGEVVGGLGGLAGEAQAKASAGEQGRRDLGLAERRDGPEGIRELVGEALEVGEPLVVVGARVMVVALKKPAEEGLTVRPGRQRGVEHGAKLAKARGCRHGRRPRGRRGSFWGGWSRAQGLM